MAFDTESAYVEEPTPVQLTRMEGVLNLVAERVSNTMKVVEQHSEDIGVLKSTTQRLTDQAVARDATAIALAAALKEAEETRRTKAEQSWSPITRLFAVLTAIATIVGVYFAVTPH
jgi:hypothetical protein